MNPYEETAELFKALSDPNRLMIAEMLSHGELCACRILERFRITQPTLSHHMKTLCSCGLVFWRKEGRWTYYTLNGEKIRQLEAFVSAFAAPEKTQINNKGENEHAE